MTRSARRDTKKSPLLATPWSALRVTGYKDIEDEGKQVALKLSVSRQGTFLLKTNRS